jgi:hypothetical protein
MTTNAAPATTTTAPAGASSPPQAADTGADAASQPAKGAERAPMTQAGSKPTTPATDAQAPAPKTYEVKVNGKMVKMTEEEVLARARMAEAADQRFSEAAKLRKETEAKLARIRDPEQFIEALMDPALGLNKDQIRAKFEEWYEREFIEPEKLTVEQKKIREQEAKIKQFEQDAKQREEIKAKAEQEELTERARGEIQAQIIEALEGGQLPKTNFTVRRLAYWIQRNKANGWDAPTSMLVSQVKKEFNTSIRDMVESADGEALINILGDGVIQKLRKYDLEQLRKLRGGGAQAAEQAAPEAQTDKHGRALTSADVTQRLRELQRTGRF